MVRKRVCMIFTLKYIFKFSVKVMLDRPSRFERILYNPRASVAWHVNVSSYPFCSTWLDVGTPFHRVTQGLRLLETPRHLVVPQVTHGPLWRTGGNIISVVGLTYSFPTHRSLAKTSHMDIPLHKGLGNLNRWNICCIYSFPNVLF